MKWDSYYIFVFNIRDDLERIKDFFVSFYNKDNIYYFLFFLCLPFIPLIWLIIVFYKYFIKYLWLFLDIIFKDLLRLGDNFIYNKIQKFFKYYFYELFYEVLPLKLFRSRERLTVVYFFDLLVEFILWVFNWFVRGVLYFKDVIPKYYNKYVYIFKFVVKSVRRVYTHIKNTIILFFFWVKNEKLKIKLNVFAFDLYIFLKVFFLSLFVNIWYFIRYICFFDKISLFILKIFYSNKNLIANNLLINNIKFKLLIFVNLVYKNNDIYNYLKKKILLMYDYLKKKLDIFLNNHRDIYSTANKFILIEIKNVLLFNIHFIFNRMIIRIRFLRFLKKKFLLYEYSITHWLLNKFWIKKNSLSFFLFKFYKIFNSSSKLIKYFIKILSK